MAFCKIKTTYKNITKANNPYRILSRFPGKKSNKENKNVLIPMKIKPTLAKPPPYSVSMDFPDKMYKNSATNNPK
ncbi:hypothetical protein FFL01_00990 [Flavobacterium flevense]|uniref:Uncharacterized protein n=1 Tax=Flavobacterium flevense TaxID=983 RepID=A0A4Y4AU27_9FLAO|nr:hypothetical protein FFL01_00990 [Flavobacterium flevense]